ncbi:MAG: hypothetical protein J0H32_12040, partial [Rhizobiales bacterium]|nr:hypothetical protein [Hyphomicrobiales bacterium]
MKLAGCSHATLPKHDSVGIRGASTRIQIRDVLEISPQLGFEFQTAVAIGYGLAISRRNAPEFCEERLAL